MDFRSGDAFACYGSDAVSWGIRAATCSPLAPEGLRLGPSHVAIAAPGRSGNILWWESTSMTHRRCREAGERVKGVQAHIPDQRIDDYVRHGGRVVVYRLVEIDELSGWEEQQLHRMLRKYLRRRTTYDAAGAALSGLRVFSFLRLLGLCDENQLFCSELVSAVLMRLGRLNRANPTKFHPARLMRQLVTQGTYRKEYEFHHLDQIATRNVLPLGRCA